MIAELPISAHFRQVRDALAKLPITDTAMRKRKAEAQESFKAIEAHVALLTGDFSEMKESLIATQMTSVVLPKEEEKALNNIQKMLSILSDFRVKGGQADD